MSLASRVRSAHAGKIKNWRRPVTIFVILLALFLLGTVIVLSSVRSYFGVPTSALVTELEVPWANGADVIQKLTPTSLDVRLPEDENDTVTGPATFDEDPKSWQDLADDPADGYSLPGSELSDDPADDDLWGADGKGTGGYWMRKNWNGRVANTTSWQHLENVPLVEGERIPRIIHQTWKTDRLPPEWRTSFRECREGMADYEYMLWTDKTSREFVQAHYPAHLHMYDNYKYPIQRADSIRYLILHHFGGIYMDLDMGCRRRMDLLLKGDWDVLLPITKPVGVSNDLLAATKKSAFFEQTVNGLAAFNHHFVTNYPTVMFSTGPMFLSAQFSIWRSTHAPHLVRVLPKALYGKNAPASKVPHSFFTHFYGSSWHADDSGFIIWLGTWGKGVMVIGCVVFVIGTLRLLFSKKQTGSLRHVLPFGNRSEYQLLPIGVPFDPSGRVSPTSSFGSGPLSPTTETPPDIGSALRRAGHMILAAPAALVASSNSGGRQKQKGWLYFVPSKFQSQPGSGGAVVASGRRRTASEASQLPRRAVPPPPYQAEEGTMAEVDAFLKHDAQASVLEVDEECEDEVAESPGGDWSDGKWRDWGGEASGSPDEAAKR